MNKRFLKAIFMFVFLLVITNTNIYAKDRTEIYTDAGDSLQEPINMGNSIEGTLNGDGRKYFAFTTSSNKSFYNLEFNNRSWKDMYLKIYTDVYGSNCIYEKDYINGKSDDKLDLEDRFSPNTTYYIRIAGSANAPFMINFIEYIDDYGDDANNATNVVLQNMLEGAIQDGTDWDVFKITTDNRELFYTLDIENRSDAEIGIRVYEDPYFSREIEDIQCYHRGTYWLDLAKLDKNSEYYIVVVGLYVDQQYAFRVNGTLDDYSDYTNGSKKVTLIKSVSGAIQNNSDIDSFSFVTSNKKINYKLNIVNKKSGKLNIDVYADASRTKLVDSAEVYGKQRYNMNFTSLSKKHKYYISVSGECTSYSINLTPQAKSFANCSGKIKGIKRGFVLKLNKPGDYSGYEIRYKQSYSYNSKWHRKIYNTTKKVNVKVKGLYNNCYYDVQIRAFYKYKGKKYYSEWINITSQYGSDVCTE